MLKRLLLGSAFVIGVAGTAHAATDCTTIKNDTDRLKCYDDAAQAEKQAGENVILVGQWTGRDSRALPPFHVDGPWFLGWNLSGDDAQSSFNFIEIEVRKLDGGYTPHGATSHQIGTGNSFVPASGDFYLQVTATGSWTLAVWKAKEASK